MQGDEPDEYEPRARIHDAETGRARPVRRDQIQGLDAFTEAWKSDVDLPHRLLFSGWQMADDAHPAGSGHPGYRLVHKTIRTVPSIPLDLMFPNIQVRFQNGPITWGEPRFEGTLPGRRPGNYLIPEWGTLVTSGNQREYTFTPNVNVHVVAHQETTPDANYVEILYHLPVGEWTHSDTMLAAGRAGVASVTAMLDFMYGERLVGPVVTEEVGEIFDDWHWNRLLGGRTVSMESQARPEVLDANILGHRLKTAMEGHIEKSPEERSRIRVAAQWYWHADAEPDLAQRYVSYWLCIEALELGENANIKPLKRKVARVLGVEMSVVSEAVGRMYGLRNGLVHGAIREVENNAVDRVSALAAVLLERRTLGQVSAHRLDELRARLA